jgi:hypothetical protein
VSTPRSKAGEATEALPSRIESHTPSRRNDPKPSLLPKLHSRPSPVFHTASQEATRATIGPGPFDRAEATAHDWLRHDHLH